MSMLEWAKNEIAIASKRERGDKPESEWDYGCWLQRLLPVL